MLGRHITVSPGVDRFIERQMRHWEFAQTQKSEPKRLREKQVEDFIAISLSVGAPGAEIAAKLGERLNWPVFDREIVQRMSQEDSYRAALYATFDERDRNWLEDFVLNMEVGPEGRNDYFRRLCETLLALARSSHAIYLGRGAGLILPRAVGLRVKVTARHDYRVKVYAKEHGIRLGEAARAIQREEDERSRFYRHHFRSESADLSRDDLVINMERFTTTQAVDLILSALAIRGMMPESAPAAATVVLRGRPENN